MTLPQLHWKKVSYATGVVGTAEDVLNAIYAALQETTYHDGSTRTPGSGSAWTVQRYQNGGTTEAVYATPPSSAVSGLRVIIAGVDSGSPSPTMLSPDTHVATFLHGGMNRNSGAFNAWDDPAPFTSGDFTGYWRWVDADLFTVNYVHILESEEAILICIQRTNNTVFGMLFGAIVDPLSDDPLDEEQIHQRIFGMAKSNQGLKIDMNSNGAQFFNHVASDASTHFQYWAPNSTWTWGAIISSTIGTGTQGYILPSGAYTSMPVMMLNALTSYAVGFLRGIYWAQQDVFGTTISSGGVEKGHFVCGSTAIPEDTMLFRSN